MQEQSSGSPSSHSNNNRNTSSSGATVDVLAAHSTQQHAARFSSPFTSSTHAAVDILLCIHPAELERQFWEAPETQRLLRAMDILAVVMVVQNMLAAMQVSLLRQQLSGVNPEQNMPLPHAEALGCINQVPEGRRTTVLGSRASARQHPVSLHP